MSYVFDIDDNISNNDKSDVLKSGLPVFSKDGYFWDLHKHRDSLDIIEGFLPHNSQYMCHMELYNYLKSTGILPHVCIDNFVVKYVAKYPDKSKLFLDMAYASSYANQNQTRRKIYTPETLFEPETVSDSLNRSNIDSLISCVLDNTFKTDIDIVYYMGFRTYQHIKYHLFQFENIDMIDVKDKHISKDDPLNNNVVHMFEFLYPDKTDHKGQYLFHGSSYFNWYSIILNGLKVPGHGTEVLNGSSYGVAIYTATSSSTSSTYTKPGHSQYNYLALAILQTNAPPAYDGGSIKTYGHENDVRLRYIFVINTSVYSITSTLDKLVKELPTEETDKEFDHELFGMNEIKENHILTIEDIINTSQYMNNDKNTYTDSSYKSATKVSEIKIKDNYHWNEISNFVKEDKTYDVNKYLNSYYAILNNDSN